MLVVSDRDFAMSKIINSELKIFNFEQDKPIELSEDIYFAFMGNNIFKQWVKPVDGKEVVNIKSDETIVSSDIEDNIAKTETTIEIEQSDLLTKEYVETANYNDLLALAKKLNLKLPNTPKKSVLIEELSKLIQ